MASKAEKLRTPQDLADDAKARADAAHTKLRTRWTAAEANYNKYREAAEKDYGIAVDEVLPDRNQPKKFNQAAKMWDQAAGVDIPPAVQSAEDELSSVRSVAKEWLAAALALFGLFSFTALFFGDQTLEAFDGRGWGPVGIFIVVAVLAVGAAVFCCFFGTRAAHGWPTSQEKKDREADPNRHRRGAVAKLDKARNDLFRAVFAAGVTVAMILGAVGTVFYVQVTDDPPILAKVTRTGERVTCGTYEKADAAGITVNDVKAEKLVVTPWAGDLRVQMVRSC